MDLRDLDRVAGIVEERKISPGQHVYFEGDIATEFYVVASGRVRVYIPSPGGEIDTAIVQSGRMFGEVAMLDGGPRLASALALQPTTLLVIPRDPWMALIELDVVLPRRVFTALGIAARAHVSHAIETFFISADIPDYLPPAVDDVTSGEPE
jgi:CRP-like cAMP-binding protein